ncbi:DedA family protein [Chitinophaga sp. 22321]|uniref:VTT domain-containing protein n=1 Tax=Chitinophaga hostae TaxID=2831022 RepID=A0ABS5JA80_9BACT|nr:VTT domain-containing protein [Chitinophaga hostae]MBS0032123.1 VTT domain-containing protein [Chitinophaga hostae]
MSDAASFIGYGGLLFLFLSVYAQTGLFFCFFLPSGGFMFTAGVLIATGGFDYNLVLVCTLLAIAGVAGNITGYWFGKKTGHLLYNRKDSRFFRRQYLDSAEQFYNKHGAVALSAGMFLPLIRTFAPVVAGMIRLQFRRFLLFTTIGSIGYAVSFTSAGYLIGSMPFLRPYLKYFIIIIVTVVTIPVVIKIVREFRKGGTPPAA